MLVSLIAVAPITWAWLTSAPYRVTVDEGMRWMDAVPATQVALVLGAGVREGQPTSMLARRLDIAADLYQAGKVKALLLSGDNSRVGYDEPTVMRDYLVARGIPAGVQVLDYAGFDTWDSCVRARQVFGAHELTVVTQAFHLPRAVALCRTAGLSAFGVGDDSAKVRAALTYSYAVREFPAAAKAFLDSVVFRAEPRFPGPRETSLERVLAGAEPY
ncbi:SanA/YdcF family protein [Sinosporangium siamense]|uniref:Membrane protein n=1 Tax=Sinosporangium siamense TaxID=1367973 RepID=A0A919RMQ4_9ACTN|nr:ElyC/SanA/YdcF family protein [Sinosporangium siamense]GII96622.1 membrane protein [Sinosporangium siamense]